MQLAAAGFAGTAGLALGGLALPSGEAANLVDRLIRARAAQQGITLPRPVSDAVFARRTYLDLWGLLPTPEQLAEFVSDSRADKRERLIDRLLADRKNYAEHWMSFWNDLLRNDEGVVYHGERKSISSWLLKALQDNLPYDRMVTALLNPTQAGDPDGYLIGVNWRGDVSASQIPAMQAAQNTSQVFLGVNLKCNSCHDSFISTWKLSDAYGMASFFSDRELELVRCDLPLGEKARPKFLFPELGGIEAGAPLVERRAAAARLFTTRENGRFPRTLVNRIWKKLFGRGLVEPVDNMEAEPWHADLLEWLAADFVDHRYDMHSLLRRIMTSQAYQLPAARLSSKDEKSGFRGPLFRRLTAEQYVDAISSITGEWRILQPVKAEPGTYSREWKLKSTLLTRVLGRPIRDQVFTERDNQATTLQALEMINGETMTSLLYRGARKMLGLLRPSPANLFDSGVVRREPFTVDIDVSGAEQLWLLVEDTDSYDPTRVVAGWADAQLEGPAGTVRLADLVRDSAVRKRSLRLKGQDYAESVAGAIPSRLALDVRGRGFTRLRAVAGLDDSSLTDEINPRVRFFVFDQQPDRERLVRVAGTLPVPFKEEVFTVDSLITRVYRHALARDARVEERRIAQELFKDSGSMKLSPEGLEDLLWAVFMNPEFQFIQ